MGFSKTRSFALSRGSQIFGPQGLDRALKTPYLLAMRNQKKPQDRQASFDDVAAEFDRLTRFDHRLERERPVFERLLHQYGWRKAVDAGCGSGVHAIVLAQLGVEVVGIDISAAMLARARQNAQRFGVQIRWVEGDLAHTELEGGFDAVVSLGNVFALLLGPDVLEAVVARFRTWLRPGGQVLVQMLNFERILAEKRRLIAANEVEDTIFVRYYDFALPLLQFNLLRLQQGDRPPIDALTTTEHYPWQRQELLRIFEAHGFDVRFWGNLQGAPFDPRDSENLVVFATLE